MLFLNLEKDSVHTFIHDNLEKMTTLLVYFLPFLQKQCLQIRRETLRNYTQSVRKLTCDKILETPKDT